MKLDLQLDNYIDDVRQNDSFKGMVNLAYLSLKLVHKQIDTRYIIWFTRFSNWLGFYRLR